MLPESASQVASPSMRLSQALREQRKGLAHAAARDEVTEAVVGSPAEAGVRPTLGGDVEGRLAEHTGVRTGGLAVQVEGGAAGDGSRRTRSPPTPRGSPIARSG